VTPEPHARRNLAQFIFSTEGWPLLLVPFIPIAIILEFAHGSATAIFLTSALGVIPTAALMGRATEELAVRSGPGIGGFLNVTFGNAPEIIIAFFALQQGLQEVVKASLVGSILGNILLVMGAAMLVGGLKRDRQTFDRTAASVQSSMLLLACVALMMPAIFALVVGGSLPSPDAVAQRFSQDLERLSLGVAIVLILTYVAGLIFSLKTHKDLSTLFTATTITPANPGRSARPSRCSRSPASPSACCPRSSSDRSRRRRSRSGCRRSSSV
jgi:Ca2+:H+ antiporter